MSRQLRNFDQDVRNFLERKPDHMTHNVYNKQRTCTLKINGINHLQLSQTNSTCLIELLSALMIENISMNMLHFFEYVECSEEEDLTDWVITHDNSSTVSINNNKCCRSTSLVNNNIEWYHFIVTRENTYIDESIYLMYVDSKIMSYVCCNHTDSGYLMVEYYW